MHRAAAADWPRGKLAIALVAAVALHAMTFWNMDLAARQQLASLRTEAGALALSVAPPRMPDRDNAALVYQQAFEAMGCNDAPPDSWEWEDSSWRSLGREWTKWENSGKITFDLHDPQLRRLLGEADAGTGATCGRRRQNPAVPSTVITPGPVSTCRSRNCTPYATAPVCWRWMRFAARPTGTVAGRSKTSIRYSSSRSTSAVIRSWCSMLEAIAIDRLAIDSLQNRIGNQSFLRGRLGPPAGLGQRLVLGDAQAGPSHGGGRLLGHE